jgi:DNA polymerase-4
VLHVRCRPGTGQAGHRALLALVHGVTPAVQALPPSAVLADVTDALRYWDASPSGLAERIRTRAAADLGVEVRVGGGPTWAVAAMASKGPQPVTAVPGTPDAVRAFLGPLPVGMLHGIGPVQAELLTSYGLHTVGLLAAAPERTVARILGERAGHLLRERARGAGPRAVTPTELPGTAAERRVPAAGGGGGGGGGGAADPRAVRAALLEAAAVLDERLRRRRQRAGVLTVEVALGGGSTLTRTRSAPDGEPRADLVRLFEALDLRRTPVRGVTVTAGLLTPAGSAAATGRISLLHQVRDHRRRTAPAMAPGAVRPTPPELPTALPHPLPKALPKAG